jgi:hypothetical protein
MTKEWSNDIPNDEYDYDSDYNRTGHMRNNKNHKPKHKNTEKREHFSIDSKIHIKMDLDFALDLGQFLLDSDNPDKRFKSFGHNLRNLSID